MNQCFNRIRSTAWQTTLCLGLLLSIFMAGFGKHSFAQDADQSSQESNAARATINLVVMDPLSAPLACDCVQGYAQRKYEILASWIAQQTGIPVRIVWAESLKTGIENLGGRVDVVIGKESVVISDALKTEQQLSPVAQLTGKDGSTTQTGLVVVRRNDPALTAADLIDYRIFFGPKECDEKHMAPITFIKEMGGQVPEEIETSEACSTAATELLELSSDVKAAAIISSYAQPLLEGCGTIKKGDLRVIGETEPVPFITAFTNKNLPNDIAEKIVVALMKSGESKDLLLALESESGFVEKSEVEKSEDDAAAEADAGAESEGDDSKKKL